MKRYTAYVSIKKPSFKIKAARVKEVRHNVRTDDKKVITEYGEVVEVDFLSLALPVANGWFVVQHFDEELPVFIEGKDFIRDFVEEDGRTLTRSASPILDFFKYNHRTYLNSPEPLQKISAPICALALDMDTVLKNGAEKSAGLRKLLEAKDCFVRAGLN